VWDFDSMCLPGMPKYTADLCPGSLWKDVKPSVAGSLTLGADGHFSIDRHVSGMGTLVLPKSCFRPDVVLDDAHCEDLAADVAGLGTAPVCGHVDPMHCLCVLNFLSVTIKTGSYDQAAATITLDGSENQLCASGSTLQMKAKDPAAPDAFLFALIKR
jgi:hypothetical protein